MAQRKKRPPVRKRKAKSIARRKARKRTKPARKRPVKRTAAKATPRKRLAEAKLKRGAKKVRKQVKTMKPSAPVVETVVVDVVEEPVPGVTVVTEFEATQVREAVADPEEPDAGRTAPPEE